MYRIDLPSAWNIYNILSIAQLKLYFRYNRQTEEDHINSYKTGCSTIPDSKNQYDQIRDRFTVPGPIYDDQFEIDYILDKRTTRKGRGLFFTQYLIYYTGHGPDHDKWVKETDINAPELIEEYEHQK